VAALRRNMRLRKIWMTVNRLDYDLYQSLCDSAVENGTVRLLAVCPDGWEGDRWLDVGAVRQVLDNRSSSVRHFRICGNGGWAPTFFDDVVQMLRTNVTLEAFDYIYLSDPRHFEMLLGLLRTYNFTLRDIALWSVRGWGLSERQCHARVKKVLARNRRMVKAYDTLCLRPVPRVRRRGGSGQQSLGPEAIARIHAFPTLLYRLLRQRGLAVALVEEAAAAHQHGRRRRRNRVPSPKNN
jgi:hypothetical protein